MAVSTSSVTGRNSKIGARPRYPVWLHAGHPTAVDAARVFGRDDLLAILEPGG